jgi:hypothetical protein
MPGQRHSRVGSKVATGQRIINGKTIDKTAFVTFADRDILDFIRSVAQLFCCMVYRDGSEFLFVPLNNLIANRAVNLSGKSSNAVKYSNIPGFEADNSIFIAPDPRTSEI